jgi:plastocyanin
MIVDFVVPGANRTMNRSRAVAVTTIILILLSQAAGSYSSSPPESIISGTISLVNSAEDDPSNVAVWLEPMLGPPRIDNMGRLAINQRNKEFVPRVVIATPGQQIDFPNNDPFQHNVFSNSEVKRFDMGIFQSGESRAITVGHTGIISVYCNIHPEMEAFIVVIRSQFFCLSNERGEVQIRNVPPGYYRLKVWHERATPEKLEALTRQVAVNATGTNLGIIKIDESGYLDAPHKNKENRDYTVYPDR